MYGANLFVEERHLASVDESVDLIHGGRFELQHVDRGPAEVKREVLEGRLLLRGE